MPENPEPDDRLVRLENLLDEHQRVRRNSIGGDALRRAHDDIERVLREESDDNPATERERDD